MIRAALIVIYVVLYCIVSIPILLVMTVVRKFSREKAELAMLRVVQCAFRILLFMAGTKITLIGEENIPREEAGLFVGNHQSFFDTIMS